MKINKLEIENVKRIKAVRLEPAQNGLTVIGGNNNQGKTSVLDSIAWALGGEKYRPSEAARAGSAVPPALKIVTVPDILITEGIHTMQFKGDGGTVSVEYRGGRF